MIKITIRKTALSDRSLVYAVEMKGDFGFLSLDAITRQDAETLAQTLCTAINDHTTEAANLR